MPINSIKDSRILLSPLNWGLGHVSRTIPVIDSLLKNSNEIIICCDENQKAFYLHYFPALQYLKNEGYPFEFQGNGKWKKDILKQFFSLNKTIKKEKQKVEEWIKLYQPDLIISDQRYGFHSNKIRSIIISHQLNLPTGRLGFIFKWWNAKLLERFDEIWIPDTFEHNLSGKLSKNKNIKHQFYLGICSRFSLTKCIEKPAIQCKYLGIVSGPFPYNQQLLEILIAKFSALDEKCKIIAPSHLKFNAIPQNIELSNHLSKELFLRSILESEIVISRCGYSTLMDLTVTKSRAILIPTPGQAEQIYLAKLHHHHLKWKFKTEQEFIAEELE